MSAVLHHALLGLCVAAIAAAAVRAAVIASPSMSASGVPYSASNTTITA